MRRTSVEVLEGLAAIEDIERESWKQREGLPITHPRHWSFYRNYAAKAASRGALMLCTLEVGGQPIAFDFGVLDGGTYFLLQTSFRESAAETYPGLVLRKLVTERLIELGAREVDFGTGDSEWKSKWTRQQRRHLRYEIFGSTMRSRVLGLIRRSASIVAAFKKQRARAT